MMYPVKRKWQSESPVVNQSQYPVKRLQRPVGCVNRTPQTHNEAFDIPKQPSHMIRHSYTVIGSGLECSGASKSVLLSNTMEPPEAVSRNGLKRSEASGNVQNHLKLEKRYIDRSLPTEMISLKKNNTEEWSNLDSSTGIGEKEKATQPVIIDERCTEPPPDFSSITDLILYLPPDDEIKNENACRLLLESCKRSSVSIKIDATRPSTDGCLHKGKCECIWTTHLLINGVVVSTVRHSRIGQSKLNVCEDGLNILKQFQPVKRKTPQEIQLKEGEVIPGLVLYFDNPQQEGLKKQEEQRKPRWSAVLDHSCRRCNLPLTWFEDKDFVLSTKLSALALIKNKPITVGYHCLHMHGARSNSATQAIKMLKQNHPVVYKSSCDLPLREAQLLNPSLASENSTEEETTEIPGVVVYLEYPGEENEKSIGRIIQRCATMNNRQLVYDNKGIEYKSAKDNRDPTHHFHVLYDDILLAGGSGIKPEQAKNDAYAKALRRLMKTQPVVYAKSSRPSIQEMLKELVADQSKWHAIFTVTSEFTCQRYSSTVELLRAKHQFTDNELIAKYITLSHEP